MNTGCRTKHSVSLGGEISLLSLQWDHSQTSAHCTSKTVSDSWKKAREKEGGFSMSPTIFYSNLKKGQIRREGTRSMEKVNNRVTVISITLLYRTKKNGGRFRPLGKQLHT